VKRRTDLEHVILGITSKFGPCTTYVIRGHFTDSPSAFFSSSTGSVYPAVRRLTQAGLLAKRGDLRGRQRRTLYSITPEGRAALSTWLAPPLDEAALTLPFDSLRTRFYFIGALSPAKRRAFLEHALAQLEARLPQIQEYVELFPAQGKTHLSHLAARGALFEARARIRWLRECWKELEE